MPTPVPYSGTLDVAPQTEPLSPVHQDTPAAAFGGAVAGAVTHLGEVAQGVGKELFERANAMQMLNEQVKAKAISARGAKQIQSLVDTTAAKKLAAENKTFTDRLELIKKYDAPSWLHMDADKLEGAMLSTPTDLTPPFEINLLVDSFSK